MSQSQTNSCRLVAFGVALPEAIEQEVLGFIKDGIGMSKIFTSKVIQQGIMDLMQRQGVDVSNLPRDWSRRIVDQLFRRERQAGRIEIFGANSGRDVMWRHTEEST